MTTSSSHSGDSSGNCDENLLLHTVPGADGTAAYAGGDADNMEFTLYGLSVDLHLRGLPNLECTYTGNVTGDLDTPLGKVSFNAAPVASSSGFPRPGSGVFTAEYVLYVPAGGFGRLLEFVN